VPCSHLPAASEFLVSKLSTFLEKKLLSCYLLIEQYVMKMAALLGICFLPIATKGNGLLREIL